MFNNCRYGFFDDHPDSGYYRINGFTGPNKEGCGATPTAPRTPESSTRYFHHIFIMYI